MKKYIKKIKTKMTYGNVVGAFTLALSLSLMSFKFIESRRAPADGWYEITITDPMDAENETKQNLSSSPSSTPPPLEDDEQCAQNDNDGNRCSIHLSFNPSATTVPTTVAQAQSDPLVTVGNDAREPE